MRESQRATRRTTRSAGLLGASQPVVIDRPTLDASASRMGEPSAGPCRRLHAVVATSPLTRLARTELSGLPTKLIHKFLKLTSFSAGAFHPFPKPISFALGLSGAAREQAQTRPHR